MNIDHAKHLFFEECSELLGQMESHLLRLEVDPDDTDSIAALFRVAHTIKGTSGIFGYEKITSFVHVLEHLLSEIRDGKTTIDSQKIDLLLKCRDRISTLVHHAQRDQEQTPDEIAISEALVASLEAQLSRKPKHVEEQPVQVQRDGDHQYHILFQPGSETMRQGLDALSPLRLLATRGRILNLLTGTDNLPVAKEMDPEKIYLSFEILFQGSMQSDEVERIFEFFRDDSTLRIHDETLVAGPADGAQVEKTVPYQNGNSLSPAVSVENRYIRVEATKLDQLINLVGELVIASANIAQIASRSGNSVLIESSTAMSRMIGELREHSLQVRMVKIGETFARFNRTIRDLCLETGKDVRLVIQGGDTELDKTLVEKITDPVMHLIRNSIDHGIETPHARQVNGKKSTGTITLNSYQETGSVVIEISDDGQGFRIERIIETARNRGLIDHDRKITPDEAIQLVFRPGFSTAETVTRISGRGVGMDVVQKNIESLRGTISIENNEGQGAMVRIRLPLTLAIIDGFLVRVGSSSYVIPMDMLTECLEAPLDVGIQKDYINLRGEVLPFLRLRDIFRENTNEHSHQNIVVVRYAERKAGFLVDELLGELQTVIKPLGKIFTKLKGISGATIIGNGDVALILDVPSLVSYAVREMAPPKTV